MGLKSTIGKLLPIAAAGLALFFPAAAPIIVGAAGIVGAYIATDGFSLGDWGAQAKDADLIQANFKSTQKTIPIVYGKRRVGSNDVFMEVSGEGEARTMWIVSCLAEGECDSIAIDPETSQDQIYIDSLPVWEFNKKHGENNGIEDIVKYYFHSGTSTQTVDTHINTAIPKFTDALRNTCYVVWEIKWVKGLFAGMPTRQVVLNGRKIRDIRSGSTGFSRNPALHIYDFLTNDRFGLGFSEGSMDQTSFRKAATYCEGSLSHPAWEVNYVVASQIKSQSVLDTLLAHFRGMLTWYDGLLFLKYAQLDEEILVGSIDDSDIARDDKGYSLITVNQPSSFMIPDSALVKYISEHKNWTLDDVYIGDQLGFTTQYEFPGFTEKNLAMSMGVYMLERSQLNRTYTMTLRASNIVYEPNDIITVSSTEAGLDQMVGRVIQSNIVQDGMMNITVVAETQSLYNKYYDLDPDQVYKVNIADPSEAPPSVPWMGFNEEIYDYRGRSFVRLNVDYDIPTKTLQGVEYPWFDYAEVHVSYDGGNSYNFIFNAPDDFQIDPVSEGQIWVALVSVSTYGQKQAFENATVGYHDVRGVSDIPPVSELYFTITVTGQTVVIYAPLRRDPDIEGWEIRIGNDWFSNDWDDASLLSITSNPTISFSSVKTGDHTMWLDVKGKNGLYSGNPIYRNFTIEKPPVGYTDEDVGEALNPIQIDYEAGTHVNTRAILIGSDISLIVDRGPSQAILEGTYTSPTYHIETHSAEHGRAMLISVEAGTALLATGNTWDHISPVPGSGWNDLYPPGEERTWTQMVGKSGEAADIRIEVETSPTGTGDWVRVSGLEKITATVYNAEYIRFLFTIEDKQLSSYYAIGPATAYQFVVQPKIKEVSAPPTAIGSGRAFLTTHLVP